MLLFDPNVVDKYFGGSAQQGSKELFVRCAIRMLGQLDQRLASLKNSLEQEDKNAVVFFSHQLKSGFYTAGSPLLGSLCEKMELQARRGCLEGLKDHYSELVFQLDDFKSLLSEFDLQIATWLQKAKSL